MKRKIKRDFKSMLENEKNSKISEELKNLEMKEKLLQLERERKEIVIKNNNKRKSNDVSLKNKEDQINTD
jgi:hypothetical protein